MNNIEKTVFISYRRANATWARSIYQFLTQKGYDVFFDYMSIRGGDFFQIISENIHKRAHFLILLTPSALERCNVPDDIFRREIEIALDSKRNIIPVLLNNFDFGDQSTIDNLKGKLKNIQKYNGLKLYIEYFDAGMDRLCNFLNIPLDNVLHPTLPPISPRTKQILDELKSDMKKQAPVDEQTLSAQGWFERAFILTNLKEKIRLYTKAIELDPKLSFAYYNRGIAFGNLEQHKKALENFDDAIKLNPEDADFYIMRGITFFNLDQHEKMFENFDQAIKLNPENAIFYIIRGSSYSELEQYEKALENFDQAIKLNPENANFYVNRGSSYGGLEQYEKALENFDQAIKLNPEGADFYVNRGIIFFKLEQHEKALENVDKAIKLNPKDANFYFMRGMVFFKLEKYKKAIENVDQAIKLNSEDADFYNFRGNSYDDLKQYEKALENFDQAIKLNPENANAFYNKASVYALQGKGKSAIKWLRKALQIEGDMYCELSSNDSDFDGIRDHPDFRNLLKEFCSN